jgi:hypothetical protein
MGSGASGTGPGTKLKKWKILLYKSLFFDYVVEPIWVENAYIPFGYLKIIPNCIGHQ